jgi:Flp pilus assembly protein CpaB
MAVRYRARQRRGVTSFAPAIVFLGGSILMSALVLSFTSQKQEVKQQPIVVAEFDTVSLPVPTKSVPAGVKGKDILYKFVSFPKQQIPQGAITDITLIADQATNAVLPADLPLFESNFSKAGHTSNPVIERIPAGMRAMTIRVDATTAVEGWAGSGAIVDVLLVTKDQTKVVAEKVRILSAERSVAPVEGSGTPSVPNTITVLVTQEQCLAINTAIPLGKIAFALRSTADEATWSDSIYTAERLQGAAVASHEKRPQISGFVSVKDTGNKPGKQFAFTDGRWIKTDAVPTGFLVDRVDEVAK